MSNLRNNIVMKGAILTIFLLIAGVFVAVATVDEEIDANWLGNKIETTAWNFMSPEKCYQIRYYQPETLPDEDELNQQGKELEDYIWDQESQISGLTEPYDALNNPTGFYVVNQKFQGNNSFYPENDPYKEELTFPGNGWVVGDWIVILMKSGDVVNCNDDPDKNCCKNCIDCTECCNDPDMLANSYKVHCPVKIPIPEFSTIALPIAAILGLMFILHSRRRKED